MMGERGYPVQTSRAPLPPPGTEVERHLRALDGRDCPLGSMREWPPALRSALQLILPADVQMSLFWGPDHVSFYNDAYAPVIGDKHPRALGRPAREGWAEMWDDLEPMLEQVRATGDTLSEKNRAFYVERRGGAGEIAYFDYSFSPVRDERGEVAGVLCVTAETTDRVRAARSVAEERARLAEMFDQSPGFMAVLRQPGHVIELANETFMEMVGRRDVVGLSFTDLLPLQERDAARAFLDEVAATRRPFRGQGVRAALMRDRFVDLVVQPVADRNGAIGALFVDGNDVTDRVRAEERLLLSTESLRLATEAAELGIWDVDLQADQLTWSERTKAHFGISPGVAVSMDDFYAGLHPDDLQATAEAFEAAIDPERRAPYDVEYRTLGAEDGLTRWVAARGRALFDETGTPLRAVGTTLDITARKGAEELLRETESRFRSLADTVPALMWVIDENGLPLFANRWFLTLFGWTEDEVRARGLITIIHPDDRDRELLRRAEAFAAREPWSHEVRVVDKTGETRWLRTEARPRFIGGRFAGYVGVGIEVTDAHLAAEALESRVAARTAELAEANNRLTAQIGERERVEQTLHQMQRLEAVGQLTSGVAHDFNNLLTVVVGNTGLVERAARAADLDARTLQRLENIRVAAERGAALTQQLLAFSRRQRLATRVIDLNETVARMRPLFEGAIGNAITVDLGLEDGLWPALVDPTQIELVILNLAINARDAMAVGGTVTIRTANVVRPEPTRPEHPPAGEHVMVAVADTGTGMSPDVLNRVFEPFFTTKPVGKGSGLGLAQVFGFAKQSGGGVLIESREGEGTDVCVFLPRAEAAPAPAPRPGDAAADADLSRTVVLVVDDDDAVRGVTADMIAGMGATVAEASSGDAALAVLRGRSDVDLILADFAMPGMNGAELARRAAELRPDVPLLMLTGYADLSAIADVPADAVVQKPVTAEALRERVVGALAKTRELVG
ncbi:PAS domain-containing hybrid sensor histidine kinase/response regulator [Sphingomonas lenta]|uniref:histidine kinase n=1 Tax=Sphingomonas lenta TaxID=1141887 RepID=A0A2A2SGA9_9SPHN|nr:PAS domain S-box protein [Sphingomonas lenta]PAX08245.1 hypothetical protein CKY28_11830 [Sphingomonas lenta]